VDYKDENICCNTIMATPRRILYGRTIQCLAVSANDRRYSVKECLSVLLRGGYNSHKYSASSARDSHTSIQASQVTCVQVWLKLK